MGATTVYRKHDHTLHETELSLEIDDNPFKPFQREQTACILNAVTVI